LTSAAIFASGFCGVAHAAKGDIWLRCALTETPTTASPNGTPSPTHEDIDRVYVYVFNPRRDTLLRYEDGVLKDLNGLGVFDGVNRSGSVVVTPVDITYTYSVAPHIAEFSQVIDRTSLAMRETGTSFLEGGARAPSLATRAWSGAGQCARTKPQPVKKRQI
jgi:hypothetical protein